MKDDIHKKNVKKGEGYFEVEVNINGEYNIKDTTTTSQSTQLSTAQKLRYLINECYNQVGAEKYESSKLSTGTDK